MNTKQLSPAQLATLFKAAELHTIGRTTTCDFRINPAQRSIARSNTTQEHKYQLVQNLLLTIQGDQ